MRLKNIAAVVALASIVGNAQATLFDRGGGLVYDDVLKITWLQDANLSGNTFMSWTQANSWATDLVYFDEVRNINYSDWRLPLERTTAILDYGNTDPTNELSYMFHVNFPSQADLFNNVSNGGYWSGTKVQFCDDCLTYVLTFSDGRQDFQYPLNDIRAAWAVRDGDVAAPIPEPETYAMLLTGLGLLGVITRRRKQKLNA